VLYVERRALEKSRHQGVQEQEFVFPVLDHVVFITLFIKQEAELSLP
jgi:hypothetical protein